MLLFYWSLRKDIVSLQAEIKWGSKVLDQISRDLQDAFPNVKGFSTTNLKYMRRFYELYRNALDDSISLEIGAQTVPELLSASENEIIIEDGTLGDGSPIEISEPEETEEDIFTEDDRDPVLFVHMIGREYTRAGQIPVHGFFPDFEIQDLYGFIRCIRDQPAAGNSTDQTVPFA